MEKKYILVAEDDSFLADVFKKKLTSAGYEVDVVNDGNLAIDKAHAKKPNLILLDLIMPGKDGFDTLKDLKADKDLKDIKVLVFSNLGQEEEIKLVKQLGADDYFIKSNISVDEMLEKVHHYLS